MLDQFLPPPWFVSLTLTPARFCHRSLCYWDLCLAASLSRQADTIASNDRAVVIVEPPPSDCCEDGVDLT